jgi:glycosyltransferase involved in cell wall biosynthesis
METKTGAYNFSYLAGNYIRKEPQRGSYHSDIGTCPKISIITVTFNSAHTLRDTLRSVASQDYPNIEHIIVDGNSQDDTLEIIKSFPHVSKWISEQDGGLYDAMNKGVQLATGDIIGIINSDDLYAHKEVLSKVAGKFINKNIDALYGDLHYVNASNTNKIIRVWKSGKYKRSNFSFGWMPPHPTFFVKRQVYDRAGNFNIALKRSADYELMLRILVKHQFKAEYLEEVLVKMRTGGISNSSWGSRMKANFEDRMAWKMNDLKPYFFTLYLKPFRKLFQFVHRNQLGNVKMRLSQFL